MKHIKIFNGCLLLTADNMFAHDFPFAQYVLVKDPFNQIGIELQWGINKGMIRIDGWRISGRTKFMKLLDAVTELAETNEISEVYFLDCISEIEAKYLEFYGFSEGRGYMSNKYYILEVD